MFYTYCQNNSGGRFHVNEDVAQFVIVEARSAHEANRRAENVGLYFDGVRNGQDCPCCGDRWTSVDDCDGLAWPAIYGLAPVAFVHTNRRIWEEPGEPVVHIYYLDGQHASIVDEVCP